MLSSLYQYCVSVGWFMVLNTCCLASSFALSSDGISIEVPQIQRPAEETSQWWFRSGAARATQLVQSLPRTPPAQAKNVIVFLGDGMGLSTITAARIFAGQRLGADGESYQLSFEKFPYTALSRTYEIDQQTADSAGTMTAIMSGVKTKSRFIGVGQKARHYDCASARGQYLVSALELAKAAGLAVGVVTTTTITHATPAATYAHLPERAWEADKDMPALVSKQGCQDLAQQFINMSVGGGVDVALGGGRAAFMPETMRDPQYAARFGIRRDGRNLIAEWQTKYPDGKYVWNAEQLQSLISTTASRVLGLFNPSHMQYEYERRQSEAQEQQRKAAGESTREPSLGEMTRAALTLLSRQPKGFFLVVEGGRIDGALHEGNAYRALDETVALSDAVQVAVEMTSQDDTLMVVTADHSHTLSISGYAQRGNPILGLVRNHSDSTKGLSQNKKREDGLMLDKLGLPYTTLNFTNGPGYRNLANQTPSPQAQQKNFALRPNLENVDTSHPDYLQEAVVPLQAETHGGEDVAVFARGPGAASFHGQIEQNVIFHLIVQHQQALRNILCSLDVCNQAGIPIDLPDYKKFFERYAF